VSDGVPALTGAQRGALLDLAAEAIGAALVSGRMSPPPTESDDPALLQPAGSFVTLERGGDLLGCIGNLEPDEPLADAVVRHAIGAAFADPRLPPVTAADYEVMSIKISVLSDLEPVPVTSRDELVETLRAGIDGLVVRRGSRRATLLPAVWGHVRDVDEFLGVLWQKAGVKPGTWPADLTIERYTADEFGDPGPRPPAAQTLAQARIARNAAPTTTPTTASE